MSGACGLLTFIIRAEQCSTIETFCDSLNHILMAVSWGGYESLILPKCAGMPAEDFDPTDSAHRSFRLYVGLEEADYIIADLSRGFEAINGLS